MKPDHSDGRILIVDDNKQARLLLSRLLTGVGYTCSTAANSSEARDRLPGGGFALLLADVNMPGESGLELVDHVLSEHPDIAAIMVTALDDSQVAQAALALGAYGYVIKPFTHNEVLIAVANALRRRGLEIENRAHREDLEGLVRRRTAALERSADELKVTREETVRRLSQAIEYRDSETAEHIDRMSHYAALLAGALGRDPEEMRLASPMHDIGKVAVPDSILQKPGKLTWEEREEMERHPDVGHVILSGSGSPLLETAARIAWTHHEKVDGSGYPRGLAGDEIPLDGQIAAVADVFDALTSDRPYRSAFSVTKATEIMKEGRDTHFQGHLLDLFFGLGDKLIAIGLRGAGSEPVPTLELGLPRRSEGGQREVARPA